MTDKQTPPEWVLIEAANRSGWAYASVDGLRDTYLEGGIYQALCDMIELHEEPPVDRKVLCAREAWYNWLNSDHDDEEWIGLRAIELYEEGFGK
jgi:hypothetical protein